MCYMLKMIMLLEIITRESLKNLFSSLETAKDGQEGLTKYQSSKFDLVITDINMPRMNGIEMIENILKINPAQSIIVTSAHNDAQYLIQLIDLGIEKFLIKPIDFSKMIHVLFHSCKRLTELKELREYHSQIEEDNLSISSLLKELQSKNRELEKNIHQLTRNENMSIALIDAIENNKEIKKEELIFYTPKIETESAEDFVASFTGDLDTIMDNLESIEEILELIIHQKLLDPTPKSLKDISTAFHEYGLQLFNLHKFNNLAEALKNFASALGQVKDLEMIKEMKEFLFGIANSLHTWRQEVLVLKTAEEIHFLDNSIISDCIQTESILSGGASHNDKEDLEDLFF